MAGDETHDMHTMFREGADRVDWQLIWDRQAMRASLADVWWRMAGGRPGARVLDVGCGPGLFALRYADLGGVVTATDLAEGALRFLDARRAGRDVATRLHDAEDAPFPERGFDVAFVTNVLHHARRPDRILAHVRDAAATLLVAEFDPDGPGAIGPPLADRVAPPTLAAWLRDAGWAPGPPARGQPYEHYAIVARQR